MTSDARTPELTRSLPTAAVKPILLALAGIAVVVAGWYAAQEVVLDHSSVAGLTASVARTSTPLQPDEPIRLAVRGAGVRLDGVQLFRSSVAADGNRSPERAVAVQLESAGEDGAFQVVAADGGQFLRPDGAYRLSVTMTEPRPSLPLPRSSTVVRTFLFSTVASPHASVASQPLTPRWAEPVSIAWSEPMRSISATSATGLPVPTWIDPTDARKTWLQIDAAVADGQTSVIHVASAQGQSGIDLQAPVDVKVSVPPRPRWVDVPAQTVTLRDGQSLALRSTLPLTDVQTTTSDPDLAQVTAAGDTIRVEMPHYQQGAEFDVAVTSARSALGAPLASPATIHVATPAALDAPTLSPADGVIGVQPTVHPRMTFPEPIADQSAALSAITLDPVVDGHWQWTSPTEVEFIPTSRLPINTDLTLTLRGGPDGPRSQAGGYIDSDTTSTFRTTDFKRMDVSLSRQTMTLYEFDRPVRTIYVATGVAAAPTPTGTFYVQYKAAQMRFRGVNPDGSHYDIPDVHWVLPFWGDYTIHGAYWRPRFGTPGSDGCVSMTDGDAKTVYDWADVGTPLVIHQ